MNETVERPTCGPQGQPYGVCVLDEDGVAWGWSWFWSEWEARGRHDVLADLGYRVGVQGVPTRACGG